ncbi:hypothetical protein CaCOL14_010754 [Colletotrichum acutatum]
MFATASISCSPSKEQQLSHTMAPHVDISSSPEYTGKLGQPSSLICLTITAFRNPSLDEKEYRQYMTKVHARLVSPLMEEYGILRYNMTHNTKETRPMLFELYDPQFSKLSDCPRSCQVCRYETLNHDRRLF